MSRENGIAKHRLGFARSGLLAIAIKKPEKNEDGSIDYKKSYEDIKDIAKFTINHMKRIK